MLALLRQSASVVKVGTQVRPREVQKGSVYFVYGVREGKERVRLG